MANFHTNCLVVAADEENMCKVLVRMAKNLDANRENTEFDFASIEGLTTARDIFYQVGPSIEDWYIFSFAGAPVPEDVLSKHTPGWSSPTSSEGGFVMQLSAFMKAAERFNDNAPEGVHIGITPTAPIARGLSDLASVSFTKYGGNWLLVVKYDTAWKPNSEDLDIFFMGLPEGKYGIAFFDADEYDSYESISTFSGLHHGLAGMQDLENGDFDTFNVEDFKSQKKEYARIAKSEVDDIAKLARIGAFSEWNEFGWDEEDDEYDYDDYGDNGESVSMWGRPSVNWANPTSAELSKVLSAVENVATALPFVAGTAYDEWTEEGNNAVEELLPGDEITIVSVWEDARIPALKVEAPNGAQIGGLRTRSLGYQMGLTDDYFVAEIAGAVLSLMLPHIRATIFNLTPVSLLNKGAVQPNMSIRLDMLETDFDELREEVRNLLKKPCSERSISTNAKGAR